MKLLNPLFQILIIFHGKFNFLLKNIENKHYIKICKANLTFDIDMAFLKYSQFENIKISIKWLL